MNLFEHKAFNYFIIFVISVLTLNYQDHSSYSGLDGSYFWAFNYLFECRPGELDKISFIYGPLAFLRNPAFYGNLILWTCLFQTVLKFLLGYCFLKLAQAFDAGKRTALLLFVLSCLVLFSTETYIELPVILLLILFSLENKLLYLILIALLTAIGYYIKCSVFLTCVLIQGLYYGYTIFLAKKLDWKLGLKFFVLNLVAFLLLGLMIFKGFTPIIGSLKAYYRNVLSYNEASSAYNNPDSIFLLVLFGISLIALFFVTKHKHVKLFWALSLIMLYTSYTHGMVREGNAHYMGFITCLFSLSVTMGIFHAVYSKYTWPLIGLAFFCFYGNLGNKWDYSDYPLTIQNGPKNFYDFIIDNSKHKRDRDTNTRVNLNYNTVKNTPKEIVDSLRKGSLDFFPWELLYVEADTFTNWKPRPYLQSLNMSHFFDEKTAKYFISANAPDNVMWHSCTRVDSTFFNSIDDSYLLTNEFHTCAALIANYRVFGSKPWCLYLKKRQTMLPYWVEEKQKEFDAKNNEWINVPDSTRITGCSVHYNFNMMRGLKKLLYRDDEFYIEYKTTEGKIIKKRFWPDDANYFVWVSPYIESFNKPFKKIKAIRFSNTNNNTLHSGILKIKFKTVVFDKLDPTPEDFSGLFKWFNPN